MVVVNYVNQFGYIDCYGQCQYLFCQLLVQYIVGVDCSYNGYVSCLGVGQLYCDQEYWQVQGNCLVGQIVFGVLLLYELYKWGEQYDDGCVRYVVVVKWGEYLMYFCKGKILCGMVCGDYQNGQQ